VSEAPRRELWFVGPRQIELRAARGTPSLMPGQLLARALFSGVSQGTELLLYRGEGPANFDPSVDDGATALYPRRYGYSWVGEIVDSRVDGVQPGQRVFCLRPHGDVHRLDTGQFRLLPSTVPGDRATLAANLETALNVVWDAGIALGDDVVVLGGGIVGLLVTWLAKRAGASRVRVVEPSSRRCATALLLGTDSAVSPDVDHPNADADVVIEATGHPASLDRAIQHAGDQAVVVVASFYGTRRAPVSLGSDFHRRRLQLRASQVSRLPAGKTARWNTDRRFERVLEYLTDNRLDALLDAPTPFDEAPELFARLDADASGSLQAILRYR
jgi:2-desacetyl-2-hydroxyethyl bacteriochlorophyllide A dehydrogenase